jgi:hypothetical protein
MTRNTFAGATWDLLVEECRDRVWEAPPEEFGARYLEGVTADCLNEVDLREWIRNAPEKKPMYAEATQLGPTDGKTGACRTSPCPRTRSIRSSPTSWNGTEPWPSSNVPSPPP